MGEIFQMIYENQLYIADTRNTTSRVYLNHIL